MDQNQGIIGGKRILNCFYYQINRNKSHDAIGPNGPMADWWQAVNVVESKKWECRQALLVSAEGDEKEKQQQHKLKQSMLPLKTLK